MQDSISIALRKVHGQRLTASEVRGINSDTIKNLIFSDQAYTFMKNIPGSPSYWKKFMHDVIAMIKQLGPPTWWMTFSCADLRWNEIYKILSKLQGRELSDEEIDAMSCDEKCKMLNFNPVVAAKHFQYRLECLFKDILLSKSDPIGKLLYYAIRIEFQFRGSPHAHCFIWIKYPPSLDAKNLDAFISYLDEHVSASLPDPVTSPDLYKVVNTYQTHTHSKTCRKYRNLACRFNFGHIFTEKTIVAQPLAAEINDLEKSKILKQREIVLSKVKIFIDQTLNPANHAMFKPHLTIKSILSSLDISEDQYYNALSISGNSDTEIHLKRLPNSCFINSYNPMVLLAWQANIDIQPVFNHHRCVTYLCSYLSKSETHCSEAIQIAAKEARRENLSIVESLRKIGAAFLSSKKVSS